MSEKVVRGLRWVKGEIATTLRRVTDLVVAYGQTSEPAALDDAADALLEVRGVLLTLQLTGPARLVEEMQQLCDAMADRQVRSPQEAAEAMMVALIQLPNQLDQLDAAAEILPLNLWPTINELRESRGAPPLAAAQLQVPGVLQARETPSAPPSDLDKLKAIFREARPHFHLDLLEWYRPATSGDGLFKLGLLFYQLHRYLKDGILADLFHLAEAYAVGLQGGEVPADATARALVGRLDRVFKPLVTSPPQWPGEDAHQLIEAFLRALAKAAIQTPLAAEIQARYGRVAAPSPAPEGTSAALAGLAQAMLGEFVALKGRLDLFMRGDHEDRTPLEEISAGLHNLGRTLGVADAGRLPERLHRLADGFSELSKADVGGDARSLEPLASELLGIEEVTHAYAERRAPLADDVSACGINANDLQTATLREARAELVHVKEAILDCQPQGAQPAGFLKVPDRLSSVAGALQILGDAPAARVAEAIADLLRRAYLAADRWPRGGEFELLADAIVALELYIELVKEGEPADEDLIRQADSAVRALDQLLSGGPQPALAAASAPPVPTPSEVSRDGGFEASAAAQADAQEDLAPAQEMGRAPAQMPGEVGLDAFAAAPVDAQAGLAPAQEVGRVPDEMPGDAGSVAVAPAPARPPAGPAAAINAEFLDVFLEEAQEETQSIGEQFGRWRSNQADNLALTTLRRSFHTLKGSGRMVGALRMGDLAWAAEGLLNQVIELRLTPDPELLAYLGEVIELLPDVIAAEAQAGPLEVDALVARAAQFGQPARSAPPTAMAPPPGGAAAPAVAAPIPLVPERAPAVAPPSDLAGAPPQLTDHASMFAADEELLGIFREETLEHLEAVRAFLDRASAGDLVPDDGLVRALHTLSGSARMAGIDSIADVAKALEQQVRKLQSLSLALAAPLFDLVGRAVDGIAGRIAEIPAAGAAATELIALAADLVAFAATANSERNAVVQSSAALPILAATPVALPPDLPGVVDAQSQQSRGALNAELVSAAAPEPSQLPTGEWASAVLGSDVADGLAPRERPPWSGADHVEAESVAVVVWPLDEQVASGAFAASAGPPAPVSVVATDEVSALAAPAAVVAPPLDLDAYPDDPDLVTLFLEEARELLDGIDTQFRAWQLAPQELGILDGINRLLHTLKGGARLTGLRAIGDLSHALETRLTAIGAALGRVDDTTLELAQQAVDTLSLQFDALEQQAPIPRATALAEALSAAPELTPTGPVDALDLAILRPAAAPPAVPEVLAGAVEARSVAAGRGAGAGPTVSQIRVRSDVLNRLIDNAGEIGLYRARLTQRNGLLGFGLGELDQTVTRLRDQLRQLEIETETQILFRFEREGAPDTEGPVFDPLELDRFSNLQQLSRSLAETVNDLVSLRDILGGYQRESTDLLTQQARLADDLQDGLLRTRMVPFVQVVPRLHRLVRQTAESLGKAARLEVIGPEVELDRAILDRLAAPLEHLLRNAVDHGLESPAARAAAGKPATGQITLELSREGNEVVIKLSDDGPGLDLAAIRTQAVARGLLASQAQLDDAALMQFVFEPGFTTHREVTQISGRGVGLDVVASEIKAANGTIDLTSSAGCGTTFSIRLPLTLAIVKALLVGVGESVYAVPHAAIEGVARISRADLTAIYQGRGQDFDYRGQAYRVAYVGRLLDPGLQPDLGESRWLPLLLARVGELRIALQVDTLIESARILVKPLGTRLAALRWLAGGSILPDGRVALILDVLALLRSRAVYDHLPPRQEATVPATSAVSAVCVMVVDDSLTVRRVTTRMLERQAIEVISAKDGVEALTMLNERVPDLMLLDIEMPRMDGYELTRNIRQSERLRDLPIIMITSRTGGKHRDHALALGVNRFLGKPYQESELLDEISSLLAEQRA